jgi:hypothetical protein
MGMVSVEVVLYVSVGIKSVSVETAYTDRLFEEVLRLYLNLVDHGRCEDGPSRTDGV